MTAEEKQIFLRKLERKMGITREKIAQMEEMTQPVSPENAIGRISRMDAINNKSVMEAALRSAQQEMADMEHALKHVNDPDFGQCAQCRQPIQLARLMILPGSRHCAKCAR